MLIGILSDTHDRIEPMEKALTILGERKVDLTVHCGDWIKPDMVTHLAQISKKMNIPVKGVLGNNDHELATIIENGAFLQDQVEFPKDKALEFTTDDGKSIVVYHGEDKIIMQALIKSGQYQVLLTGHTHKSGFETVDNVLIINPGSTAFAMPGRSKENTSVAVYDTQTNHVEIIPLNR